jgi:hypothetical protein
MRIALCGSTRFKFEYEYWNALLTACGNTVYSVAMWSHGTKIDPSPRLKLKLDAVHMSKIENSDAIFVIDHYMPFLDNLGDIPEMSTYIGESTQREIEYARARDKIVFFASESATNFKGSCHHLDEINSIFRERFMDYVKNARVIPGA